MVTSREGLEICDGDARRAASAMRVPSPPKELAPLVAAAIASHGTARRICEANPATLDLALAILHRTYHDGKNASTERYTAVPYRELKPRPAGWPADRPPLRVVTPSVRTLRGPADERLGVCDTLIVAADAELSALSTNLLIDLPLLMQHAGPESLFVMHGLRCLSPSAGDRSMYRGPFWVGNLSVPCWLDRFDTLASTGALLQPECRSLGNRTFTAAAAAVNKGRRLDGNGVQSTASTASNGLDGGADVFSGEYLVCTAGFRPKRSACGTEQPLLERWASEDQPHTSPNSPTAKKCSVRKEPVVFQSLSNNWGKQGWQKRSSLSHMFRRHIRYYGAMPCDDGLVCMLFKDEVDEQWIAALNSTDGLTFTGDPALVLPRSAVRAQLYDTLKSLLHPSADALDAFRDSTPWLLRQPSAATPPLPPSQLDPPSLHNLFKWKWPCPEQNSSAAPTPIPSVLQSATPVPSVCYNGPLNRRFEMMLGSMTHNLAITRHKGEWVAIGGRHNRLEDRPPKYSPYFAGDEYHPTPGWWHSTAALLRRELPVWPDRLANLSGRVARSPARLAKSKQGSQLDSTPLAMQPAMKRAIGPNGVHLLDRLPMNVMHIPRSGLWMMRGSSWQYDAHNGTSWLSPAGGVDEPPMSPWRDKHLIIDGHHPGCVERRVPTETGDFFHLLPGGVCEYDGRLSLVHFKGSLLLYTRSNPAARGKRHVQVTRSSDDGVTWSPFEQVRLDGYGGEGDIYFFAVQINPAHEGSLLAVFPLVQRLRGCVAVAASIDGIRWSRITPLLSCSIYGERTLDQPALPAMVRRGAQVWLYVHEEVPGITIDRMTPRLAYAQMVKYEKPSSVVRYAFPCLKLANWTSMALRDWRRAYDPQAPPSVAEFQHDCQSDERRDTPPSPPPAASVCDWRPRARNGIDIAPPTSPTFSTLVASLRKKRKGRG